MTTNMQSPTSTNLDLFREKVVNALRQAGQLQKELAHKLGINAQVLSRKLHGMKRAFLTHAEVKLIIKALVAWDAVPTRAEVIALLELMGLRAESFSDQEWNSAPLNRLKVISPADAASSSIIASAPTITASHVLPAPSASLLGREFQVQLLQERLRGSSIRILTLLGIGGIGKTRLALEVAHVAQGDFADGVFFIPLAALHDVDLVPSTIVQALHLPEPVGGTGSPSQGGVLKSFLRDKALLLVLDNVEQIPAIGSFITDLLSTAPALRIVVTSRSVLHLYGEHVFDVPPLDVCTPEQAEDLDIALQSPAIRLFVERAQAVDATFQITQHNAATIAYICTRLDGLPLAIELAAARIKVMSLNQIQQMLVDGTGQSLTLLHSRTHNVFQRHKTLQEMLDWSYDLLDVQQQTLFRRLSIFVGGWTAQTAQDICASEAQSAMLESVLEQIETLIDQSLVKRMLRESESQQESPEARFYYLETIREYGLAQLTACGEREDMQRRHAHYFLSLVEAIAPDLAGREQEATIALLVPEQDNLRAALNWALEHHEADIAQRMCGALSKFWESRTQFQEAHRWVDAALAMTEETQPAVRAKLLMAAARLALWEIACERSRVLAEEALALYEALGDDEGKAEALFQIGDAWHMQGEYAPAIEYLEACLVFHQDNKASCGYAFALSRLGAIAVLQGDFAQAWTRLREALPLLYEYREPYLLNITLVYLGVLALVQGELVQSLIYLREGLMLAQRINNRYTLATDLIALGCLLGTLQGPSYAARICSAAEALFESLNTALPTAYRPLYDAYLGSIKVQVDEATWQTWWAEGKMFSQEELYLLALVASEA